MKIKYFAVLLALVPACAFADDTPVAISNDQKVVASKAYVRSKLDEKQDNIGGGTEGTVITNTGTAGTVGSKGVYKTGGTTTYSAQTTHLIEAAQANTAIQNGLNAHVTCNHTDPNNNNDCDLWQINTLSGTYMPQ